MQSKQILDQKLLRGLLSSLVKGLVKIGGYAKSVYVWLYVKDRSGYREAEGCRHKKIAHRIRPGICEQI
jgi:hypothetical protein